MKVIRPWFKYEIEAFPPNPRFRIGKNVDVEFIRPFRIPVIKFSYYNTKKVIDGLSFNPDVVICHSYNSYFTFRNIAQKMMVPFVVGIHGTDLGFAKNRLYRWYQRKIFKKASGFALRSYAIKNKFETIFGDQDGLSFVALSGIPDLFINNLNNLPEKDSTGPIKIISVCKLIKLKHIDRVLSALSKIGDSYNWTYSIVGDGPERGKLEELVNLYKMQGKVNFLGNVERNKVFKILNNHEVFIMPSYPETLGLAYLEAMACGNIVIGSKGWGIDGVVKDSINGYLCNPDDIDNILLKLKHALDEVRKKDSLIIKNSINTISDFSINKKVMSYLQSIKDTIRLYHKKEFK